jgi:predicted signal transduction protein with EAL and GGDEF domain
MTTAGVAMISGSGPPNSDWFDRIARDRRPCSVLMIDIDDFKSINDNFGHQAGDRALVELARRLDAAVRSTDMVGPQRGGFRMTHGEAEASLVGAYLNPAASRNR